MEKNKKWLVILIVILQISFSLGKYYVTLSHNGPVVSGANITLKAELFNIYDQSPNGTFIYAWKDNAIAQHFGETPYTNATVAYWNVSYPADIYPPGPYLAQVTVYEYEFIRVARASQRVNYDITDMLNGQMELKQNYTRDTDGFVSNAVEVSHKISLSPPDFMFLTKNATSIFTYWFVDCVYYGYSTDFGFLFNYTEMRSYNVEALVVASFDEIPDTTVPPPTTTPEPISNKTTTVSPEHSNVTSLAGSSNSTSVNSVSSVTEVNYIVTKNTSVPYISKYGTIFNNETVKLPFVCLNSSIIPRDITKVYGYFRRELAAKVLYSEVEGARSTTFHYEDITPVTAGPSGISTEVLTTSTPTTTHTAAPVMTTRTATTSTTTTTKKCICENLKEQNDQLFALKLKKAKIELEVAEIMLRVAKKKEQLVDIELEKYKS